MGVFLVGVYYQNCSDISVLSRISNTMVKSCNFGHQVNLDSDLVCFIFLIIGIRK